MNSMAQSKALADILVIGGGFFGYAKEICRVLELRGRNPVWFEDRPSLDTITKSLLRVAPSLVAPKAKTYFDVIAGRCKVNPYRMFL